MKKLLAVILCLIMLFSFASPAFAIINSSSLDSWLSNFNEAHDYAQFPLYGNIHILPTVTPNTAADALVQSEWNQFLADFQNRNPDKIFIVVFKDDISYSAETITIFSFDRASFSFYTSASDVSSLLATQISCIRCKSNSTDKFTLKANIRADNTIPSNLSLHQNKKVLNVSSEVKVPTNIGNFLWFSGFSADSLPEKYAFNVLEGLLYFADAMPEERYNLTVEYIYADGTQAHPADVQSLGPGESYSVVPPSIEGYVSDKMLVTGTMPNEDLTVTVTYTPIPWPVHTLTIHYQYADGSEAAPSAIQQLEAGASYSVPSPVIDGYTAGRLTVSGTMPDSDHTETVIYTPVRPPTYTLTINYRHENGTQAAPPHVQALAPGAEYSVDSPVLENYLANYLTVSGTMPEEDVTHTVTYTPTAYPLTIHYRYAGGLQASPSITRHLAAGVEYAVDSPVITGYTADQPTVSGTMPAQSLTVTVTYTRSGGGSEGGGVNPPTGPGPWWQDFDDPFGSPPLWQDFDNPFDSPPLWQDTDAFDYPFWWQDFDDPFNSPPLWQHFDDPFAAVFGRSFSDIRGDGS